MVWKPRLDIPTAYVFGYTSAMVTRPPQSLRTTPSSEATSSRAFFLSFQDIRTVSLPRQKRTGRERGEDRDRCAFYECPRPGGVRGPFLGPRVRQSLKT